MFWIGEYEEKYEKLSVTCERKLLSICGESMEMAYAKWMRVLSDIEKYSEEVEFDIKGLKIWINVFWNPDGTIRHIVYYPKPNSKNFPDNFEKLTAFFIEFVDQYKSPITDDACFSHNGTANFPIYAKLFFPNQNANNNPKNN